MLCEVILHKVEWVFQFEKVLKKIIGMISYFNSYFGCIKWLSWMIIHYVLIKSENFVYICDKASLNWEISWVIIKFLVQITIITSATPSPFFALL